MAEHSAVMQIPSQTVSHFWVASSSFFTSAVFIAPPYETDCDTTLSLYDCDGALFKELKATFPKARVGAIELDQLLNECKLESGFKHAQLKLSSTAGTTHRLRMFNNESASTYQPATIVYDGDAEFYPLNLGKGLSNYLALTNPGDGEIGVKIRLFIGKRTPDIQCQLAAHASRIVHLETEFSEFIDNVVAAGEVRAYIRIVTRAADGVGLTLLERTETGRKEGLFTVIS